MTLSGVDAKITPLQLAVCQGELGAIRVLARCGAKLDACDDVGQQAVHIAALNDGGGAMWTLWELGADLSRAASGPTACS
jgi:hypothetical protein